MPKPSAFLSYGGGVNSTALMLLLLDRRVDFQAVYADHGADWPETRAYVAALVQAGYPITVLETRREGLDLYAYYHAHRMIPARFMRHCTSHFKVRPLNDYFATPCTVYLGIDAGESHRAKPSLRADEDRRYPLVDEGIDRAECLKIIADHRLPPPIKSGCYICPFQRTAQWKVLRDTHPELWCKAVALETRCNERQAANGREPFYLSCNERPLPLALLDYRNHKIRQEPVAEPCMCEL